MNNNLENNKISKKEKIIMSSASFAAGILNGFIGTGGGIILYFAMKILSKNKEDETMKNILAATIAAIIPMSIISAVIYMIKGKIIYKELPVYIPAAVIGGITGAILLDKLKFKIVKKIFALLIIYAGIRMIWG